MTIDAAAAFTPAEVIDKVRHGVCELGLVGAASAVSAPGVDVLPLEEQPFVLVGAPDGGFPEGDPVAHDALSGARMIVSPAGSLMRRIVDGFLAEGTELHIVAEVAHRTSILPLVLQGVGLAVLPSAWAPLAHVLDRGRVRRLYSCHRTRPFEESPMTANPHPYKIATIPADGVGIEVVAAGRAVLDALAAASDGAFAFEWTEFPWGCGYYEQTGRMMAADGLEVLQDFDAIYFGAVGWPTVPDHISLWGLRLAITQNFDQWANVRPVHFHPGVTSPLRKADDTHLDWVVIRENSEGEYAGLGGRNLSARGPGNEVALQTALFTEKGCERIIRFAFDLARTRRVKKVSSVTKSNAQQYGMVLWDETFARVARDYPDVACESVLVDAMSAKFVLRPEDLSVVVASNLNADILSDLGSALAGSLGLASSANYNPEGRFPSMFEPVHGSAPDIAGQGVANPIGTILSGALMLEHLGRPEEAARLQKAVDAVTGAGVLTRDVGGTASTDEVVAAIIAHLDL